jgi:hypothetical protein
MDCRPVLKQEINKRFIKQSHILSILSAELDKPASLYVVAT